jgi:23S rRNA (uracil1939-C5)-methyltransferase
MARSSRAQRRRRPGQRDSTAGATAGATATGAAEIVEVDLDRFVAGGVSLGRQDGGRVVLAEGGLPGERVEVELSVDKPTLAKGVVRQVLVAAPGRIEPVCPEVAAGCGGCDLQHAATDLERSMKVDVVRDALARIGRLPEVPVEPGEVLPTHGHRTVLRCAVEDGRAGLRRRRSDQVHALDRCWVAHPLVDEILSQGRFPGADEVIIRVGARTGERMVVVSPVVGEATVPDGVLLVGADEIAAGRAAHVHEIVARRRFRISAGSFFQARPDGAEALIRAVARAVAPFDPLEDRLADLYGGVGLFTAGLGARRSILVERSSSSVLDATDNLAALGTEVVRADVLDWSPVEVDVVVADPARAGLGAQGAAVVAATGAQRVALVSCDPAALARDARLLVDLGYQAERVELVDMFPNTHHVEAVTALRRRSES